jgi:hypothetical protein
MVNFFIKMHLAHNNILNVSSKTQTKKVITWQKAWNVTFCHKNL